MDRKADQTLPVPSGYEVTIPAEPEARLEGALSNPGLTLPEGDASRQAGLAPAQAGLDYPADRLSSWVWQPGHVIAGLYRIEEEIKGGAMGTIHRVHHLKWDIDLVVKTPNEKALQAAGGRRRFEEREAYQWIQLGPHPNIATCYYVRTLDDGIPRIFIEYVNGGTLADWIKRGQVRDLPAALYIWVQICWGVAWAHQHGLVHRDIKPSNILMTSDGVPKITDFGLIKPLGQAEVPGDEMRQWPGGLGPAEAGNEMPLTEPTLLGGTVGYAAPEQWQLGGAITVAADVYALGVVLYELLPGVLGLPAFPDATPRIRPLMYQNYLQGLDQTLARVLLRCMATDPSERFPDASALAQVVAQLYKMVTGVAYPHQSPQEIQLQADGLNNRALSLLDLGRPGEAAACWQQALHDNPHHLASAFNYGYWQWSTGRLAGEPYVLRMRDLESSHKANPEYWRCLAWIHLERGDAAALEIVRPAAAQQRISSFGPEFEAAWNSPDRPSGRLVYAVGSHHPAEVRALAFSPKGACALSAAADGRLCLWAIQTGEVSKTSPACASAMSGNLLRSFEGQPGPLYTACFSLAGDRILSAGADGILRLWSVEDGQLLHSFEGQAGPLHAACFLPEGERVLSAGADGALRLWSAGDGQLMRVFEGHAGPVHAIGVSPDGQWALSGGWDGRVRLWELASGRQMGTLTGHTAQVQSVCFSPDGRYALSGGWDGRVWLWKLDDGRPVRVFEGHAERVFSVCISPDGRWGLSGGRDGRLRLWELSSGREVRAFEGHASGVNAVAFSNDGRYALSGSGAGEVWLWEVHFPAIVWGAAHPYPLFSPLRDLARLSQEQAWAGAHLQAARSLMEKGAYPAVYRSLRERQTIPGYQKDPQAGDLLVRLGRWARRAGLNAAWECEVLQSPGGPVQAACFSPEGRHALAGDSDGRVWLWDIAARRCVGHWVGHTGPVHTLCFSPDGRWALSGGADQTLRIGEVAGGQAVACLRGYTGAVNSACFSPDGRYILSGGEDGTVRVWEVAAGREIALLPGHTAPLQAVCFSPDGRYALSGGADKTPRVWDMADGRLVGCLEGHSDTVYSLCFSPDGRYALSAGADRTLRVWKVADRLASQHDRGESWSLLAARVFSRHFGAIFSACFSPDGRYFLSAGADKTLMMWDLESGQPLRCFWGHTDQVRAASFSPDGRYALSAGYDRTLRLWELDWEWDFPAAADWDEGALPYLDLFLTRHTPYVAGAPAGRLLARAGLPTWTEEDFQALLAELSRRGYGWLRPEGVRRAPRLAMARAMALIEAGDHQQAYRTLRERLPVGREWEEEAHDQAQTLLLRCGLKGQRAGLKTVGRPRRLGERTWATSAAGFSPDGRYAVSGGADGVLRVWDMGSRQMLYDLNLKAPAAGGPASSMGCATACFSPDGRCVLAGGSDGRLRLWRLDDRPVIHVFEGHTGPVLCAAFSPDGHYMVSGGADKTARMWDVREASGVRLIRQLRGHTGPLTCICVSPDGRYIVSGGDGGGLHVWESASGRLVCTWRGHDGEVCALGCSPDGRYVVSGGRDKTLRAWVFEAQSAVCSLEGSAGPILSLDFSPDGRYVLSGGEAAQVCLWELESARLVHSLAGFTTPVRTLRFSPDGRYVLSGGDDGLNLVELDWEWTFPKPAAWDDRVWADLNVFLTRLTPYGPDGLSRVGLPAWSKDDFYTLLAELERRGYGWLHPQGVWRGLCKLEAERKQAYKQLETARHLMRKGSYSDAYRSLRAGKMAWGYEPYGLAQALLLECGIKGRRRRLNAAWGLRTLETSAYHVLSADFSPDSRWVALGGSDGRLRLWELEPGRVWAEWPAHTGEAAALCFSPDGRCVLSGGSDHKVCVWQVEDRQVLHRLEGHTDRVLSVCFSPDGRYILSGGRDKTLRLWEAASGRLLCAMRHTGEVSAVHFSPDGRWALSGGGDGVLGIWEVKSGRRLHQWRGAAGGIHTACFFPDGGSVLTGGADGSVWQLDVDSGRRLRTFDGHTSRVFSVCVLSDARFILSAGGDKTVRLWEVAGRQERHIFDVHTRSVLAVCFSPDGRFALSASVDKSVWLWELDWDWEFSMA